MAELLRVEVREDAHRLVAPVPVLDPATAAVVEQAVSLASARAYAEGEAAGRRASSASAGEIGARLDTLFGELLAQRAATREADLTLATALATDVLGATPPASALALLERARQAASVLDDDPLEVLLHPQDHAALVDTPRDARLRLAADPSVAPGDVVLRGAWGGAELTRAALLEAATRLRAEGWITDVPGGAP
ncbi:hypothetical protein [Egicoccus halophilus]|uniref:Flagellar assembly protein FliH/Type III secretion system HrpE domain-containing protein n=1 Tax=Egicoccus halophilus TaxID=1670830 RepID=A0A8J3EUU6_9ACTN|nr:hypothetical protein [Egicoccus halophilus]GGI06693.1 hypothetical protein GCM10011354_20370 [Egicoccus halophilus]